MRLARCGILVGSLLVVFYSQGFCAEEPGPKDPAAKDAEKPTAVPLVDAAIREAMQDRDYAAAIVAIDKAAKAKDAPNDYLTYLKGRALYFQEKYDAAIKEFDRLPKEFPASEWVRRARFAKGVALARKGDFRAAELIYREQAEYLLSVDRKQEIAGIYLEFADAYFDPPKEEDKPNYPKALEFYRKALEVGPKPEKRIEVELLVAQCYEKMNNHGEAIKLYRKFIEDHAKSPLVVEARYRLGQSYLKSGNLVEARRAWEDLLAEHEDASSERIAEAMFDLSRTWRIPSPRNDEELNLGVAALRKFLKRFPDHESAPKAHLDIVRANMNRGHFDDAIAALKAFLEDKRYAKSEEAAEARNLLGRCYRSQKKYAEAIAAWQEFLVKHPADKSWSSVQREIINTEYWMGQEQFAAKKYDAARELWSKFLAKYPLDDRAASILFLFGEMNAREEKWDDAIADWRRVVSKYPGTNPASQSQFAIARVLETKLGKFEEALKEYKKVTWGNCAARAKQAVSKLTAKELVVVTERIFRSDETPTIDVTTRNIESLTVRAYKVDMETYFRKMHLARGVEGLDVALIDPDKTFEFTVPEYAEHQKFENAIEVSLPNDATAGVMAVTVSSEKLEATTMLIQSDLDIIVKSSRDEVFVLAENMRTGDPWPNARLLISNASTVFAEATTGDDGVFQQTYEELAEADDVRVFAIADGSIASNDVSLSGVSVAQGLTDRGYIYTDRPAYRAGQMVHVRGVLRHVPGSAAASSDANDVLPQEPAQELLDVVPAGPGPLPGEGDADTFTIEKDKKYTLEVYDARNRMIRQDEVVLGEFGTFHTHFVLPPSCPQGTCRVVVHDNDKQRFEGTFLVQEYKLEPVRLTIDTPRTVYYRGEEIEGTIRAEFYYGAPLAGRKIRYQLAGEPVETAETDAKGEVKFKLSTRRFRENQVLAFRVTLPERNVTKSVNFALAVQGFSVGLKTVRPVFVAGETFEVTVTTNDAESKPIAKNLTLKVFELTTENRKVAERLVEEHKIKSDDDGIARQTLKLDEGGRYVLRAEGIDRFENPVSGQHFVKISDDDDRVRLRILADRHTYKAGDIAEVTLHWREDPALALVTFQGARILDYKLVDLKKGANKLSIPMAARLAPNFDLAVNVMIDPRPAKKKDTAKKKDGDEEAKMPRRFHAASSPFTVERQLDVKIATKRKGKAKGPIRPGEKLEVTITTTDPQGKPVAAELSLAMVEQALLDRFPSRVAAIQAFFRGQRRQSATRTSSSITFAYHPKTKAIDPELLAEQDRQALARQERESRNAVTLFNGQRAYVDEVENNDLVDTSGLSTHSWHVLTEPQGNYQSMDLAATNRPQSGDLFIGGFGSLGGFEFAGDSIRTEAVAGSQVQRFMGNFNGAIQRTQATGGTWGIQHSADEYTGEVVLFSDGSGVVQAGEVAIGPNGESPAQFWGGAVVLPSAMLRETGYWNPSIVTDKKGKATLTVTVPKRSTAWKLLAKGVTTETLAGEAEEALAVKDELFGQLKLPLAFTDGDTARIVASVHNDAIEKGKIRVTLKTILGGKKVEETKTIDVKAKGIEEVVFPVELKLPERKKEDDPGEEQNVTFELTIAEGKKTHVTRRSIPLQPYGMPVYAAASGAANADTTVWVQPPQEMAIERPRLQIVIGPTVERSLLDMVLGAAPVWDCGCLRLGSELETATSDLMAALALQKLIGGTQEAAGPETQALDSRIRSSIGLLVSSQNDDGGWSWTGRGGGSRRFPTARAVWALSLAKEAGYEVPAATYDKSLAYVQKQLTATANNEYETSAILLHALSEAGRGDFALANRLYRNRQVLSAGALAHLALAFAAMDRNPTAVELLDLLAKLNLDNRSAQGTAQASLPWSSSPTELRALQALALQQVAPKSPKTKPLVDWLLAHRTGNRFTPDKATGPAAMALCEWFAKSRFEGEKYKLAVFVNDVRVKLLEVDPADGTQTIDVPAKLLTGAGGKQRINFQITGRGRYAFQCLLGGFVPAEKLKSTVSNWTLRRTYEPAQLEVDGRTIPRGFGILSGGYSSFRNPLTQLPVGQRGLVELYGYSHISSSTPESRLDYLVVTEPIPAGASVIKQSVRGGFERFEISPGAITFYIGPRRSIGTIRYELVGYLPGTYRAGPTVVRNAHNPAAMVVATAKTLEVLPAGAKSKDKYRLTPLELFELGKHYFAKKEWKTAEKHLTELLAKWKLDPGPYKQTVRMLLDAHLETGPPAKVVHYFEIVKEKWPAEEIPFDMIVKVGAAYHEMGEYERSYLVFRATVEGSFSRESGVAGFLESQGEFTRSVDVMGRLLREYPPEGYVAAAAYALAQRVYAKAPEAADDEKLREQKINRIDLIRRAWCMLEDFLTAYPDDPAADQGAFAAANALLDMEAYKETIAACTAYAKRFPKSDLVTSYWYIVGYCHFALKQHKAALEMCRKVADAKRVDEKTGRETESPNKWRAIYILGQIYHSLGKAADAIREYRLVEDRFPDALQSIEYFERKAISLPEVTTMKPGEKVDVELKFRNVASCDTKVYRIDLMKFSLMKRNLGGITKINLAGIRPHHETTIKLGDGLDYRDRTHELDLPIEKEGAYLVVCRGDELHASGLVLVSPLGIDVEENATSGRVRTTVKDVTKDRYLDSVEVKVIGSRNKKFTSGESDLRGVFVADKIEGTSTVIARADDSRYAFFRGTENLLPQAERVNEEGAAAEPAEQPAPPMPQGKESLLEGLKGFNKQLQMEQSEQLDMMYDSDQQGVEVQKAF